MLGASNPFLCFGIDVNMGRLNAVFSRDTISLIHVKQTKCLLDVYQRDGVSAEIIQFPRLITGLCQEGHPTEKCMPPY